MIDGVYNGISIVPLNRRVIKKLLCRRMYVNVLNRDIDDLMLFKSPIRKITAVTP